MSKNEDQASKLVYEVGYLLDSKLTDEKAAAKAAAIRDLVSQDAGEIIAEGLPKSRSLAYTMSISRDGKRKDHARAYFGWVKFETLPAIINIIEESLKKDLDVIRFLLIKTVREDTLAHLADMELEEGSESEDDVEDEEDTDLVDIPDTDIAVEEVSEEED